MFILLIWPWIIGGAAALGGSIIGSAMNVREARANRRWQERMANTAHQREVADMLKAGINPMARNLGGAPTPAGDRGEVDTSAGSKAVQSALAVKQMEAQVAVLESQARDTNAAATLKENELDPSFSVHGRGIAFDRSIDQSTILRAQRDITLTQRDSLEADLRALNEIIRTAEHPAVTAAARARQQRDIEAVDLDLRKLSRTLTELQIPGAKNIARFEERMTESATLKALYPWMMVIGKILGPAVSRSPQWR